MRSPSNAPPVFFLEGSTEITAIVLLGNKYKYLLTISSVIELLPAPPVPVIPNTGICALDTAVFISWSSLFSKRVMALATFLTSIGPPSVKGLLKSPLSSTSKSDKVMSSLIMPSSPKRLPSSGE